MTNSSTAVLFIFSTRQNN